MEVNESNKIHVGTIIEEDKITLEQMCQICGTNADWVFSLVQESIIEPEPFEDELPEWHFSGISLAKARSALRLQNDLGLNLAGVAVVFDLMEELDSLRAQLYTKNHL